MYIYPQEKGNLVTAWFHHDKKIKLHSLFEHGFNLQANAKLLYIGDNTKGSVPFGLHLSSSDFSYLVQYVRKNQQHLVVKNEQQTLDFGEIILDYSQSKGGKLPSILVKTNLCRKGENPNYLALLKKYSQKTGLDFIEETNNKSLNFSNLLSKDEQNIEQGIRYYLGRGMGLTPSGDDFLVGVLAINNLDPFLSSQFNDILSQVLRERPTTDVSINYLEAAILGEFSSSIQGILSGLLNQNTEQVNKFLTQLEKSGSTSGRDTITGMYVSFKHVNRNGV